MSKSQAINFLNEAQKSWTEYTDLVKKHEAAELGRVSQRTIERMAAQGKINKVQIADTDNVRFSAAQIKGLFSKNPEPVKPQPIKTTFAKYTTDKNAAPSFPHGFEKTITVQLPDNSLTLSAIGCFDPTSPTGEVKIFKWEKLPGCPHQGMLRTQNEQATEFVSLVFGKYNIRLTMTGSTGASLSKDVVVDVQMPKQPKQSDPAATPDPAVSKGGVPDGSQKFKKHILFTK
jgi:hypothetical protein